MRCDETEHDVHHMPDAKLSFQDIFIGGRAGYHP